MTGNSRSGRFRRKTPTLLTEINVTPFVDVMLVLLIIFMVTAPLLHTGVGVDLPKTSVGSMEIREENVVTLRKDGGVFLNEKRVTFKELSSKLRSLSAATPGAEVFLRADKGLPYGDVMKTMGIIKQSGIERLGMVTEAPKTIRKNKKK